MFFAEAGETAIPYDIAPIPRGGVQVEWRGPRMHIEVEIGPTGEPSYLVKKIFPTHREYEEGHDVSWQVILVQIPRVLLARS
jgi:hypothetical protein